MPRTTRLTIVGFLFSLLCLPVGSLAADLVVFPGGIQGTSSVSVCTDITKDLRVFGRGGEVGSMQTFLRQRGFLVAASTGYFGPATRLAVQRFQRSVGLPASGYVGVATRSIMKALSCSGPSAPSSATTTPSVVACPADAMACPDGSWVGRSGPTCAFVCPTTLATTSLPTALALVQKEEQSAGDLFGALGAQYPGERLGVIAKDEYRLAGMVAATAAQHGWGTTTLATTSPFAALLVRPAATSSDALFTAAIAAEMKLRDLRATLTPFADPVVKDLLGILEGSAKGHLIVFANELAFHGVRYEAQVLPSLEVRTLLQSAGVPLPGGYGTTTTTSLSGNIALTVGDLAAHKTITDCWVAYQGVIYDVTPWLPKHPGGVAMIAPYCGTATAFETAFTGKHGTMEVSTLLAEAVRKGTLSGPR